ncbi:hypothetical protein BJX96DRAFT_144923 [Aspergillus floccosus]
MFYFLYLFFLTSYNLLLYTYLFLRGKKIHPIPLWWPLKRDLKEGVVRSRGSGCPVFFLLPPWQEEEENNLGAFSRIGGSRRLGNASSSQQPSDPILVDLRQSVVYINLISHIVFSHPELDIHMNISVDPVFR